MIKSAVERKLQILTDAIICLDQDGSSSELEIDWSGYRGLGNFLRHSYHKVDDEIVWNTLQYDLPELKAKVQAALET